MADVTVQATGALSTTHAVRNMVMVTPTKGYMFFHDNNADLVYKKTTDGGLTWAAAVSVSGAVTQSEFDVWFDQWTPGDKGSLIHIWMVDTVANDDVRYCQLNTTNDVLSSPVNVYLGTSAVAGRDSFCSGAKMRGGNLYCVFNVDSTTQESGLYRSVDNGATWAARTDPIEADADQGFIFPGNEADPNDAWILYSDASADELTLKVHSNSSNTNTESAAINGATGFVENTTNATGQYGFAGSIRHSDGHLIAAFLSEFDPAGTTADFKVYDINGTASITALTDIATNIDDCYYPSVFIDNIKDVIYVAYAGKSDGTETLNTTNQIYYAYSTNRGLTWTKDQVVSQNAAGNMRHAYTPLNGPLFIVNWINAATPVYLTNYETSKLAGAGAQTFENYKGVSAGSGISVGEKVR